MSSANLLSLARIISKDPDHSAYTSIQKFEILSAGQEAIVRLIDVDYLDNLKKLKSHTSIASPGTFTVETDYIKNAYFSFSDGSTEVEYIGVEEKGKLRNSMRGGTDVQPIWYTYLNSSNVLTGKVILSTYSLLDNSEQYYIMRPPEIALGQEPLIIGFDDSLLAYFKYLLHLMEGQAELSQIAYQSFMSSLAPFIRNPSDPNKDK